MMKFVVSMHVGNFAFSTNAPGHDYTVTVGNNMLHLHVFIWKTSLCKSIYK